MNPTNLLNSRAWLGLSAAWRRKGGDRLELWLPRNWPAEDSELRWRRVAPGGAVRQGSQRGLEGLAPAEDIIVWTPAAETLLLRENRSGAALCAGRAADRAAREPAFCLRARDGRRARGGGDAARAHGELAGGACGRRARPDATRSGDLVAAARRPRLDAVVRRRGNRAEKRRARGIGRPGRAGAAGVAARGARRSAQRVGRARAHPARRRACRPGFRGVARGLGAAAGGDATGGGGRSRGAARSAAAALRPARAHGGAQARLCSGGGAARGLAPRGARFRRDRVGASFPGGGRGRGGNAHAPHEELSGNPRDPRSRRADAPGPGGPERAQRHRGARGHAFPPRARRPRDRARIAPARARRRICRSRPCRPARRLGGRRGIPRAHAARTLARGRCAARGRRGAASGTRSRSTPRGRQIMNFAWTEPARARWEALGARERRVASALAVAFGAALFYLLLWSPVETGLAKARTRLASAQAQLARVQGQAALAAKVRATPRVAPPANPA